MKHYLTIVHDTQYSTTIDVQDEEYSHHAFLVYSSGEDTSCDVTGMLHKANTSTLISILWIIHNQKKVTVNGKIAIEQSGTNVSGHLQEEILILWDQSYTLTRPILDVKNNNVSASHGAKIHKVDRQQLFYLTSRGLTTSQSKKIIVSGLIDTLFDRENIDIKIVWPKWVSNSTTEQEELLSQVYSSIFPVDHTAI